MKSFLQLFSLIVLGFSNFAQASLPCLDLSGEYYLEYPIVGKISYLKVEQTDCNTASFFYKMKNGMLMSRTLEFDNTKRVSARDDQAGWISYEWIQIEKDVVNVFGEKIENGKVVETSLQTFKIDSSGNLVDKNENFNEKGKSIDAGEFVYDRIIN